MIWRGARSVGHQCVSTFAGAKTIQNRAWILCAGILMGLNAAERWWQFFKKVFRKFFSRPKHISRIFFLDGKIYPEIFPGSKFLFRFALTDALRHQTKRRSWLPTIRANSGTRERAGAAQSSAGFGWHAHHQNCRDCSGEMIFSRLPLLLVIGPPRIVSHVDARHHAVRETQSEGWLIYNTRHRNNLL